MGETQDTHDQDRRQLQREEGACHSGVKPDPDYRDRHGGTQQEQPGHPGADARPDDGQVLPGGQRERTQHDDKTCEQQDQRQQAGPTAKDPGDDPVQPAGGGVQRA
jgi:hypothetical protein